MKLHEISVKRPVAVTMVVLIFVVLGIYSMSMLPLALMPKMDMSMAIVMTQYDNVGSQEIENLITKRVEGAVSSVSGVDTITSQSSEGTSLVMAQFNTGTDMDEAVSNIKNNLDMVSSMMPDEADKPTVLKMDSSMMPVAQLSVSYDGYDLIQTKKFVDDTLEKKLESADGVASVSVMGAQDRIIEVEADPNKLRGYNLSSSDLVTAITMANKNLPAGTIEGSNKKMAIRIIGQFDSLDDVSRVPITLSSGQVIYLSDVATVKDTFSDQSSYARLNGENSISISVSSESDANTVDVVDSITAALENVKKQNPKFKYNMTMEQGSYIKDAVSSVASNAVSGAFLAILILLLFLGSLRTSLVIGISMPISVITTFIGMYFSGMTLNVVSLGGLALGVGMLVDNSVVIIENIFRRRKDFGEDAKTSSVSGTGEVIGAVVASVLTTCIVYVPILFIDNIMAIMFKQLAFAIIFSQCASLITTLLLIPMLSSRIKNDGQPDKKLAFILKPFTKFLNGMYVVYEKVLRFILTHRKRFIAGMLALFVLSIYTLTQIGMTLMASADEGLLSVSIELPQGAKLEDTNELTKKIEDTIAQNENVETVFSSVGSSGFMSNGSNVSSITVTLKDKRKGSTNDIAQQIRDSLKNVSGATIEVSSSNSGMSMSADSIDFRFTATDEKKLAEYVKQAEKVLAGIDGVTETSTSIAETKPEVSVRVDSSKAARYGLSATTVTSLVSGATYGTTASRYSESGSEYDIKVKYPENYVNDVSQLKNMQIKTPSGQWISLSDIADVGVTQSSSTLTRVDQKRVITLTGKLYGTDMTTVNRQFDQKIASVPAPEGVSKAAGGSFQVMIDAMKSLLIAILLGIVLMYMVMAAQFENLLQPFIILLTLPMALIGVVLSLVITRSSFSVISCIGVLMLGGIIVNNAIVLIDFINQHRREDPDSSLLEIIVYSAKTRLRPVLMTSLTSILGFIPMAASTASGSEMMRPLAVVLVGGLAVGTFLTLLCIPVIFMMFENSKTKRKNKKAAKKAKKLGAAEAAAVN